MSRKIVRVSFLYTVFFLLFPLLLFSIEFNFYGYIFFLLDEDEVGEKITHKQNQVYWHVVDHFEAIFYVYVYVCAGKKLFNTNRLQFFFYQNADNILYIYVKGKCIMEKCILLCAIYLWWSDGKLGSKFIFFFLFFVRAYENNNNNNKFLVLVLWAKYRPIENWMVFVMAGYST